MSLGHPANPIPPQAATCLTAISANCKSNQLKQQSYQLPQLTCPSNPLACNFMIIRSRSKQSGIHNWEPLKRQPSCTKYSPCIPTCTSSHICPKSASMTYFLRKVQIQKPSLKVKRRDVLQLNASTNLLCTPKLCLREKVNSCR